MVTLILCHTHSKAKVFENIVGKGENALYSIKQEISEQLLT